MTHETDGVNAYEYLYERKAYELGYEDGAYRLEQMPHMDYIQQHYQIVEDIGASTVTQVKEYVEGWKHGYSNSQPLDRQ